METSMSNLDIAGRAIRGAFIGMLLGFARVEAGPVPLPFSESFNTPTMDAVADYPHFTAQIPESPFARDPEWRVDENGVLRAGSAAWAPQKEPSFSVTPDPKPTGEVVIKVDMGWNGADNEPPVAPGFGAAGLRLGRFEDTLDSENTVLFHPGYEPTPGAFRVEGEGGFPNQDMGFIPAVGVLHHVEIHSFPDGLFNIKVTDGLNPANIYENSFTNPLAYGGDIGFLAVAGGSPMYDNLSIMVAGPSLPADLDTDDDVDGADLLLIQRGLGSTTNAATLDAWRSSFGTHPISPAVGAVPEPTGWALGLLAWPWIARRRALRLSFC